MSETQKRKFRTWNVGIGVCRVQQWWVREREKVIRKQTLAVGLKGDLEYLNRRFSRFGILVNSQCSSSLVPHALFFSGAFFVALSGLIIPLILVSFTGPLGQKLLKLKHLLF